MSSFSAFSLLPQREREYQLHQTSTKGMTGRPILPSEMGAGEQRIVGALATLLGARYMNQICETMNIFSRDLVWSANNILLTRKGHARVAVYLAKFLGLGTLEPNMVQVYNLPGNRQLVDLDATVWFHPTRTIFFLPSFLLPKEVPLHVNYRIGVNGGLETGTIELVHARLHNLPAMPAFLRALVGFAFGSVAHVSEPVWGFMMEVLGDEFYRNRRLHLMGAASDKVSEVTSDTYYTTIDYGNAAVDTVKNLAGTAVNTASNLVGSATGLASQAINTATGTAQQAVGTAAASAQGAYDYTRSAVQGAADVAGDATNRVAATAHGAAVGAREGARDEYASARASAPGGDAVHQAKESMKNTYSKAVYGTPGTTTTATTIRST